jgi:pimeloyl-ACP methyl ester carboxylesterase
LLNRFRGTLDWWDPEFLDYLASERDVIIFDNVGIGYSTGQPRDSVEALAEGAVEFLDVLGLPQADLLGWSLGGMIAQQVLLQRPDLVRKLVVAGSTPGGQVPGSPPPSEKVLGIMAKSQATEEDLLSLFFPETESGRAAGYDHLARVGTRLSAGGPIVSQEAAMALLSAIGKFASAPFEQVRSKLETLSHPILYAAGMQDWLIPALASFVAVEHVRSANLVIYGDAGHAFLFQHAGAFTREVKNFLDA